MVKRHIGTVISFATAIGTLTGCHAPDTKILLQEKGFPISLSLSDSSIVARWRFPTGVVGWASVSADGSSVATHDTSPWQVADIATDGRTIIRADTMQMPSGVGFRVVVISADGSSSVADAGVARQAPDVSLVDGHPLWTRPSALALGQTTTLVMGGRTLAVCGDDVRLSEPGLRVMAIGQRTLVIDQAGRTSDLGVAHVLSAATNGVYVAALVAATVNTSQSTLAVREFRAPPGQRITSTRTYPVASDAYAIGYAGSNKIVAFTPTSVNLLRRRTGIWERSIEHPHTAADESPISTTPTSIMWAEVVAGQSILQQEPLGD